MRRLLRRKAAWRIVRNNEIDGYLLRPDRRFAQGIATITLGQTISHPLIGKVTGNQVDLSFDTDVSPEQQVPIIRRLVAVATRDGRPAFAALTPLEQERAAGIGLVLPPINGPGHLETPQGDQFGINARGPVQLYFDQTAVT